MSDRPYDDYEGVTRKVTLPPTPPVPQAWHQPGHTPDPGVAYITVNQDESGKPVEVFLRFRHNDIMQGTVNALCRMISLALQAGIPADSVINTMLGQHDGLPAAHWKGRNGGFVRSVADAVGRVLADTVSTETDE